MRKGRQTREKILETAAELFARHGIEAIGLQEVLRESKAPRGSLYHHFPGGKEQLATEALTFASEQWRAQLMGVMDTADTPGRGLARVCRALAKHLEASDFEIGCPIATTTLEYAHKSEAVRNVCGEHFTSWRTYLTERFAKTMPPERAAACATLSISTVEGALVLARAHRSTAPILECAGLMQTLLDDGIPSQPSKGTA